MKGKTPRPPDALELQKFPFRNLFLNDKDDEIAIILINYFGSIRELWPLAWDAIDEVGNILPRSNAFKAFMRYLRTIYIQIVGSNIGAVPTVQQFKDAFSHLEVYDNDFTSGNFKPGSGGEADFYKLLRGEKTIQELKN
jgi:hypothetical protein